MYLLVAERIAPSPVGVEIGYIVRHIGYGVVNLIVEHDLFSPEVLKCEMRTLTKWHLPVRIHTPCWIDGHGERVDIAAFAPTIREKVAIRTLYRGMLFSIPVCAKHEPTPMSWVRCHPDVLNCSRFLNVGK